jgi:hypothetical protein
MKNLRAEKIIRECEERKEPYFVLRAQDILSTMSLLHYATLVETYVPYSELPDDVAILIRQFRDWQQNHPTQVKLPD